MKTKLLFLAGMISLFSLPFQAQIKTNVRGIDSQISDNLDLRAIASLFGDSYSLSDFERRLNDPKIQISNLDLNNDNLVDYLRVVESVINQSHFIIIQAVLDRDVYQDVTTIDIEKNRFNNVAIQVVGNADLFGVTYIYEPVYHNTPRILSLFWTVNYLPYCSTWTWNYYPKYYYAWNRFSVYKYRRNITIGLNTNNRYHSVNFRSSRQAKELYRVRNYNNQHHYTMLGETTERTNYNNRVESFDQTRNTNRSAELPNSTEKRRETSENRSIEIREIEIPRKRTQYVDIPHREFPNRENRNQHHDNQRQGDTHKENNRRN